VEEVELPFAVCEEQLWLVEVAAGLSLEEELEEALLPPRSGHMKNRTLHFLQQ
jgi:hypothetical protein